MAQVARAQTDAGGGPQSLRRLNVQFRGMGLPEQELTVTGTVSEVADGIASIVGALRAERQADHPQRRGGAGGAVGAAGRRFRCVGVRGGREWGSRALIVHRRLGLGVPTRYASCCARLVTPCSRRRPQRGTPSRSGSASYNRAMLTPRQELILRKVVARLPGDGAARGLEDARRRPRARRPARRRSATSSRCSRSTGCSPIRTRRAGRVPTDAGHRYFVDRLLPGAGRSRARARARSSCGARSTRRCA